MAAESTQPGRLGAFSGFDFEIRRRAAQQVELATPQRLHPLRKCASKSRSAHLTGI